MVISNMFFKEPIESDDYCFYVRQETITKGLVLESVHHVGSSGDENLFWF